MAAIVDYSNRLKTAGRARPMGVVQGMVYHHTAGSTAEGAIEALNNRGLGAQYIIDRDGTIYQTFPEGMMARHMREPGSRYRTDDDALTAGFGNENLIGVEVVGLND